MKTINDVTSTLNALCLANQSKHIEEDMEIDGVLLESVLEEEVDITLSDGQREMYEIYVECCFDDAAKAMEIYLSIMNDVVGGHENAIAVLASYMHNMNCFFVNLTRAELEKLVESDNDRVRGIYPPYKPVCPKMVIEE